MLFYFIGLVADTMGKVPLLMFFPTPNMQILKVFAKVL